MENIFYIVVLFWIGVNVNYERDQEIAWVDNKWCREKSLAF